MMETVAQMAVSKTIKIKERMNNRHETSGILFSRENVFNIIYIDYYHC